MKLEQSFEVDAPLERVWQTLIDVEHVAPCLPGAAVTGRNDDGSYNGTFTVKIGPTTASYTGRLEMENVDEGSHTATMQAQGTDKRGQGGAKATILSRLAPADGRGTRVEVVTDYHITGRLARFGRGGMIEDISERLLREFAKRLQTSLAAAPEPEVAEPVSPVEAAPAGASEAAPATGYRSEPPSAEPLIQTRDDSTFVPVPVPEREETLVSEAPAPPSPPEAPVAPESPVSPPGDVTPPPPGAAGPIADEPGAASEPTPPPPPSPGPPPVVTPPPPPATPPPPPGAQPGLGGHEQLEPSEPLQGLSLVGGVIWGRVKRNPAPAAAAGVAVVLLMARRRRRRNVWR